MVRGTVTRLGLPAGHKAAAAHGTHSGNVAEPRVRARFFDIGLVVIAIAVLVGVPYAPALVLGVFGMRLLLAFSITALGVMSAI